MFATLEISHRLLARVKYGLHTHCNCALFLRGTLSRFESLTHRFDTPTKLFCRETQLLCHLLESRILSIKMDPVYIAVIAGLALIVVWSVGILIYVCKTEMRATRYNELT